MPTYLDKYLEPILTACVIFPMIAAFFTLPFMVRHYRRFGGIAFMRVIVVYSFILYCMCAFFLTVLPLPSFETVRAMQRKPIGWIPFYDLYVGFEKAGFTLSLGSFINAANWKRFLTSSDLFQVLANIVMQIPLGVYLRYYFRCSWKKTLLIGFLVSFFYETVQLTGLFFLYPQPYRYTEVDDLINNTLGCMIGFGITPLFQLFLPSRDDIDRISYDKGHRVTVIRRVLAAGIDWILYTFITAGLMLLPLPGEASMIFVSIEFFGYFAWVLVYFVFLQRLFGGYTLGKAILRIKVVREDGAPGKPTLRQLFTRYGLIYYLALPYMFINMVILAIGGVFLSAEVDDVFKLGLIAFSALMVLGLLWFVLRSFRKWGVFPHGHYSHTIISLSGPRKPLREILRRRGKAEIAQDAQ